METSNWNKQRVLINVLNWEHGISFTVVIEFIFVYSGWLADSQMLKSFSSTISHEI